MDTIEILLGEQADSCVIWLHGLGADGHDFEPVVPQMHMPNTRFIFPHAPMRPVTLNQGMVMRAWYDIMGLSLKDKEDLVGMQQTQHLIEALIHQQHQQGIPFERIFLGGFSQGGAAALYAGLRFPHPLAGVFGLSCYLPFRESLTTEQHLSQQQTPIFIAHGEHDEVLPLAFGALSQQFLKQLNYSLTWHTYPLTHSVSLPELQDLRGWMSSQLK